MDVGRRNIQFHKGMALYLNLSPLLLFYNQKHPQRLTKITLSPPHNSRLLKPPSPSPHHASWWLNCLLHCLACQFQTPHVCLQHWPPLSPFPIPIQLYRPRLSPHQDSTKPTSKHPFSTKPISQIPPKRPKITSKLLRKGSSCGLNCPCLRLS